MRKRGRGSGMEGGFSDNGVRMAKKRGVGGWVKAGQRAMKWWEGEEGRLVYKSI